MKLVQILAAARDPEVAEANVAFHLAAGVAHVLVSRAGVDDAVVAALDRFVRVGRAVVGDGDATTLARAAAADHGADWVLVADANEFWWPRGENLTDPLGAMPARYGVVQGLVREFVPDGRDVSSTRVATPGGVPLERALRPLYRADAAIVVEPAAARSRVPLRAWYPFEVLRLPLHGAPAPAGPTVEDARLRDALDVVRGGGELTFRVPDLVDDAAYAVDCAAVGEVDLPRLERELAELEARIAWLEQRLWPRLLRRVTRLARR
jgi:hypothetical protein